MKKRVAALAIVALGSFAPPSHAAIEDTIGLGPRAIALGGSYAARPGDFASAYYNPAGVAPGGAIEEHGGFFELSLSFVYAHPTLFATGARDQPLATPDTPDTAGIAAGARFSVGQPFHLDGLDMALSVYAPSHLFQWSIRPDDDVQWALLGDRTQVLSTHAALAYRATRWLSLGVGLRALFGAQTNTTGRVTDVRLDTDAQTGKTVVRTSTQLGVDSEVFGRVSPLFGATITPIDALRIGLVYRHKSYVDDWGSTRIDGVPDLGAMGYTHRFAHYFEPSEATAAVSVDLGSRVDVSADLTFSRWSEGLSTNRNFFSSAIWGDTWTPAFGARIEATRELSVMGGYRFVKSPLDNFGGPSNLLDNDRHVLSTGLEVDLGKDTRVTLALQHTLLVSRTDTKDYRRFSSDDALVSNPGYPSLSYGGHLFAASAGVEARW